MHYRIILHHFMTVHEMSLLLCQRWQCFNNCYRLQTHRDYLLNQFDNILGIVGAVWVVDDAAPSICLHTILIYHPFQCGTRAEAIVKYFRGHPVNCEKFVVDDLRFVFGEFHFLDAPVEWDLQILDELEIAVFRLGFVVDMDFCKSFACLCESPEVFGIGDVWQIAF